MNYYPNGQRVLVTGAAGGIGAVLVHHLMSNDNSVTAVDDLSSGRWANLSELGSRAELLTGSIVDQDFVRKVIPWHRVDHVVHLAAMSSLPACQIDPARAYIVNVAGTALLASEARRAGISRFVNASTSALYEGQEVLPFTESMDLHPHLVYPMTKWFAEQHLQALARDCGFPSVSLRFFNVFGPFQDFRRPSPPLLNYIVRQLLAGEAPQLHSNGDQARDYVSVDDICAAIGLALITPTLDSLAYNVCGGEALSVNEFYDIVAAALEIDMRPVFRDATLLWDHYTELFEGRFPLQAEIVSTETNKTSVGDNNLWTAATGWRPTGPVRSELAVVARRVAAHIGKSRSADSDG